MTIPSTHKLATMYVAEVYFTQLIFSRIIYRSFPYILKLILAVLIMLFATYIGLYWFRRKGYIIQEKKRFLRLSAIWYFSITIVVSVLFIFLIIRILSGDSMQATSVMLKAIGLILLGSTFATFLFYLFTRMFMSKMKSAEEMKTISSTQETESNA